ncbi:hypothetical protein BTM25_38080 [Actinomadura rubteroloni]|uniref:Secreted protein n=1 Tax=Actinomadura rubteroloni TaxID=1926885 RepID=A0A2P4UJB9_9ACTN|nr:hypothetical protein [Actinomadura rubteroloni]POM25165.1 hypothetical protein BTM25_38080 [Actinomadura rubteroloni]
MPSGTTTRSRAAAVVLLAGALTGPVLGAPSAAADSRAAREVRLYQGTAQEIATLKVAICATKNTGDATSFTVTAQALENGEQPSKTNCLIVPVPALGGTARQATGTGARARPAGTDYGEQIIAEVAVPTTGIKGYVCTLPTSQLGNVLAGTDDDDEGDHKGCNLWNATSILK